jgi:glycosyltransferase involved in cell wall biosynthesis
VRYVLAGNPPKFEQEYFAEVKTEAERLGVSSQFTFVGFRDDFPGILAASDLFVSASRNEASPIAIMEAMAASAPIVATDVGDCAALLEGGKLGHVVPSEDADALGNAILDVLERPEEARQRSANALDIISKRFSSSCFWDPLEDLIREVCGVPRQANP